MDSQVELLIGTDVPEALQPREVIPSIDGGPYATRVDLGWVINGPTGTKPKYVPSSCFFVKSVQAHPMCVACADFTDAFLTDDQGLSRDDLKFMNIVEDSVTQCGDGHYQMPPPLRNPHVFMPENRVQAERRALCLKRKFSRDPKFRDDYVAFLEEVIKEGFAEKVPSDVLKRPDGMVWYIPHHGVYHQTKLDKIRVAFDCSAQYRGTSLNSVKERPCTRRGILSVVSSVYDHLGMAAPFILPAKLLLQDLCRKGLRWDDEIPSSFLPLLRMWLDGLPKLSQLSVDRCVRPIDFGNVVSRLIHHFCDACQSAYGAVSNLRLVNSDGQVHCSFLIGKSRLAPLKQTTIPRLELAAATVSIRLNKVLSKEFELPVDTIIFWTDSMTDSIRYIGNESKRFHTYVANCVAFIRENSSPSQWRYIDTKSNPADDASRGVTANAFMPNDRWIKGRAFLLGPESEWVNDPECCAELADDDAEVKREPNVFVVGVSERCSGFASIVQRFSSWFKLLKFIAICLLCQTKFVTRKRESKPEECNVETPKVESVTRPELENAEREVFNFEQNPAFAEELETIREGNCIKKSSALAGLDPILVSDLLRVGGRLNRAPLSDDSKHQIIIPKDSHLARLLVSHFHWESGHSAREYVIPLLRERFWLIRANTTVRKIFSSCFTGKQRQGSVGQQKMAALPLPLVTPDQPPFTCDGIDYFGPFYVRQKRSFVAQNSQSEAVNKKIPVGVGVSVLSFLSRDHTK